MVEGARMSPESPLTHKKRENGQGFGSFFRHSPVVQGQKTSQRSFE